VPTGIELVEAIRAGRAEPPPGIATLGLDRTHEWLTAVEPGRVEMVWEVEGRYANLEGAVICSWIVALADQALFFATQTACLPGEGTRMSTLQLECIHNVDAGPLRIVAEVDSRADDRFHGSCVMRTADGELAARVTAVIDILR
jgi:acyl-coenzyme A thioesterase PaaI-like protein